MVSTELRFPWEFLARVGQTRGLSWEEILHSSDYCSGYIDWSREESMLGGAAPRLGLSVLALCSGTGERVPGSLFILLPRRITLSISYLCLSLLLLFFLEYWGQVARPSQLSLT